MMTASGLASMPPLDRDEPRFVQATKQMTETGDYGRHPLPGGAPLPEADRHLLAAMRRPYAEAARGARRRSGSTGWSRRWASPSRCRDVGRNQNVRRQSAGLDRRPSYGRRFRRRFRRPRRQDRRNAACLLRSGAGRTGAESISSRRNERRRRHLPWIFWAAQGAAILIKGPIAPLLWALTVATCLLSSATGAGWAKLKAGRGLGSGALIVLAVACPHHLEKQAGPSCSRPSARICSARSRKGEELHGVPPGFYVLTYCLFMWPFGLALGAGLAGAQPLARRSAPALLPRLVHSVLARLRTDPDETAALCAAGLSRRWRCSSAGT